MGTDAVPEVDGMDYLAVTEFDHNQRGSVRAGHTDSRVAVDGYECPLAIGRPDNFMPSSASLADGCNLPPGIRVNQTESLVSFIGDEQQASR
jgi:hypothetical protein